MASGSKPASVNIWPSRHVHWILLIVVALIGYLCTCASDKLMDGALNRLGTIGVFVTIYGVMFSIVEVMRLQSVAATATSEARDAYNKAMHLVAAEKISDCHHLITTATDLTNQKIYIPDSLVLQIIRKYSELNASATGQEKTENEVLETTLTAYVESDRAGDYMRPTAALSALISMTRKLSYLSQTHLKFSGEAK